MKEAGMQEKILGRVAVSENDHSAIGYWSRLDILSQTVPVREVIFCEGTLSFQNIIVAIEKFARKIKFKIHASGSRSIVGSDSKDSTGQALSKENAVKLADPYNLRLKRLLDALISFFALITFPVHFFTVRKPLKFFKNCFAVLFAQKTWIGYATEEKHLPQLRKPVVGCNGMPLNSKQEMPVQNLQIVDYWYARDYEPSQDIKIILKSYKKLGG
jgi:hypothetical protein